MYAFSAAIEIPAGATMAGFSDRMSVPTAKPGRLQVQSIGSDGWQVCAIDALYAGILSDAEPRRVIAASHTHYAPLLDPAKPALGHFSASLAARYEEALQGAAREKVAPDRCTLLVGQVDVPVYRRFDFPASALNGFLTRHAGRYPNDVHPVDRNVYVFAFSAKGKPQFSIVYHACHPVTRHSGETVSPDYVGALRAAVTERLGAQPCLFFLGCAGDIRPNLAEKRSALLPRNRFNWRFKPEPSAEDEKAIDEKYRQAVLQARAVAEFAVGEDGFQLTDRSITVQGLGEIPARQLDIGGEVSFLFLPFEVAHRYQLEVMDARHPRHFIVSCAGNVRGYLPHANQLRHGGYEVEGSRAPMGLERAITMESRTLWP